MARNAELDAAIGAWTAELSIDDVVTRLEAAGVPVGKIFTAADICADPHYEARGMIEFHDLPNGGGRIGLPGHRAET